MHKSQLPNEEVPAACLDMLFRGGCQVSAAVSDYCARDLGTS